MTYRGDEYNTYRKIAEAVEEEQQKHGLKGLVGVGGLTGRINGGSGPSILKRRRDPMEMIGMRLNWPEGMVFPLPHISCFVTETTAIIFVVNKDNEPVTLVDDPALFPSDTLITQLRLLTA